MSDPIKVREMPEATTQINKPLVVVFVALLVLVLGIAIVYSFNQPSKPAELSHAVQVNQDTDKPAIDSSVTSLPTDYQQAKEIQNYLSQPKSDELPAAVQKELTSLRAEQQALQSQLAQLNAKPATPTVNIEELKQAETSGLFFPGVSPPTDQAQQAAQQAEKASDHAADSDRFGKASSDSYVGQNMQMQKMEFLKPSKDTENIYSSHSLQTPLSPYEIQAGTIISAQLLTAIDTSLPGEVVAQIQNDLYDSTTGRYLLVPKGSKLIGRYDSQISYGQTRVLIYFYRVIRPDGTSILLDNNKGADLFGQSGMAGDVNNHWGRVIGSAVLSTLLSMGAGVSAGINTSGQQLNAGQSALLGGASSIAQTGQSLTNRAMNIQPTLKIPMGYQFNVIVNKDMILQPFNGAS